MSERISRSESTFWDKARLRILNLRYFGPQFYTDKNEPVVSETTNEAQAEPKIDIWRSNYDQKNWLPEAHILPGRLLGVMIDVHLPSNDWDRECAEGDLFIGFDEEEVHTIFLAPENTYTRPQPEEISVN